MDINHFDDKVIYCPKLGHNLNFNYCRTTSENSICNKIRDCWFERICIDDFLHKNYDIETIEKISNPPKSKTLSLIELINKAKEYQKNE